MAASLEPQQHTLVQDNDCHWFVIPVDDVEEFDAWVEAMENSRDWSGKDFTRKAVDGPHTVHFSNWKEVA